MRDLVLEGVRSSELEQLAKVGLGRPDASALDLKRLEAKGWLDLYDGVPILTLAGRMLIDAKIDAPSTFG